MSATAYLRQLCQEAIPTRYPDPSPHVWEQLDHELAIIEQSGLANYFLIVWDIVAEAKRCQIRCQGRGSAANSLVAYLLSISPIDPLAHDLVFERFLSAERQLPPDIDLDFEAHRREEMIQYVYQKYGHTCAAMACTFVCFHQRSAWQDVGKALGLPASLLSQAAVNFSSPSGGPKQLDPPQDEPTSALLETVRDLCRQLHHYPRHIGLHNGGMILTNDPLAQRLPIESAAMPGRTVVQWDKDSLETAGLIKIDLLGLRMLSAISETVALISETTGQAPELERLTFDDPRVYDLIAGGGTIGVFQVESRAQAQLAPRLKARCFNDLIVSTSLIRPGPVQGNMVRPYIERRLGLAPVTYLHPKLEPALAETLGIILYQEQVLKVARDLAGFSAGLGEQLRRALGNNRGEAEIESFRAAFLAGAEANDVPSDVAETVFEQLKAFGSYSFAKSHAASFSVLIYQSAWLKCYYPAQFYCGLLNNQPMGFWSPAVILGDARRHGIAVLPVDVNASYARCTVGSDGIRLGFNYIDGLGEAGIARLMAARQAGAFTDLANFCRRTRLSRRLVEHLIMAGACDRWGLARRRLLWELPQVRYEEELDLIFPPDGVELPPLSESEALMMEYQITGLSTGPHVMSLYRAWLTEQDILSSWELAMQPDGQWVRLAGLVVVHQSPPTAKGFHFITLEDEGALVDVIVRPQVYAHYRDVIHKASLLLVEGTVQQQDGVVNLLASRVMVLPKLSASPTEQRQGLI
jgi:error-prone DNA polymerase